MNVKLKLILKREEEILLGKVVLIRLCWETSVGLSLWTIFNLSGELWKALLLSL